MFVLKMGYSLHRFLILGPNLGITARFCPFMPSCVHRFLISGSNLRIDAGFSPVTPSSVHRFLISGPDLRIDASARRGNDLPHPILFFVPQRRMARLQQSLLQRSSASDSNLRCHEGEWFRLQQSLRQRPSAYDSNFRCREEERFRLQNATTPPMHRFLISRPDLGIAAGFYQETPSSVQ